jgi:hypothetical protein
MTNNGSVDAMVRQRLEQRRELADAAEVAAVRAQILAELEVEAAQAQRRAELEAAQGRARDARVQGLAILEEIDPTVEGLAGLVRELQTVRALLDRGVHYEAYGVRDGLIDRRTIDQALPVDPIMLGRLVKAGQVLAKVGDLSLDLAQIRARQMAEL